MKEPLKASFGWISFSLAVVLIVLLSFGVWFWRSQEQVMRKRVAENLGMIARLKAAEIAAWRKDQLQDASLIAEDPFIRRSVSRYIAHPDDANLREIHSRFRSLARQHDYADILIIEPKGRQIFSLHEPAERHTGYLSVLEKAFRRGLPVCVDLHTGPQADAPHLSVVMPLFSGSGKTRKPVAAFVFVSSLSDFLSSTLGFWPLPSESAEILLVRKEGDQALVLNNLRHRPDAALKLSFPLSRTEVPAVMAVLGKEGFVEGTDYRGVNVAAFLLPVEESPWFLVAEVDSREVFADWRFRSVLILLLFLGLILFIVAGALFFRQREAKIRYRDLYFSEAALRAEMERHSVILKAIGDAVIATDSQGRVEILNPVAEALTGWSEAEARGRPLEEVFHIINEDTKGKVENPVTRVLREGIVVGLANHTLLVARDGSEWPIADSGAPIRDDKGNTTGVVLVFRDRSAERAAQESLRASEERFRITFEQAGVGISHLALDGRWLRVNEKFCDILGYSREELLTKNFQELTTPEDLDISMTYFRALLDGSMKSYSLEKRYVRRDQSTVWIDLTVTLIRKPSGEPDYIVTVANDITDRKKAEEEQQKLQAQLMQAHKMESVGRLAGGVAHDYNNMLSVIIGNAELAMVKTKPDDPLHANLKQIMNAATRSADITRKLLAFARKQTISPKVVDLNGAVEGTLKMLRQLIGEDIEFSWQPAAALWPVKIDPTQLDQVLANLCVNARDAIKGVGKITIETERRVFDGSYCDDHPGFKPGEYVMLAVSDNGCGMDKETMAQIFDPFFTTKSPGEGTGLGLAMVWGIVKQNNGFINVYSEPGSGTTFKIYLPRYLGATEADTQRQIADPLEPGYGEGVLLVEDEVSIMEMGRQMLEKIGYRVFAASTPQEALRLAAEHTGEIRLVVTDVVLPDMNGRVLTEKLRAISPDIKTLFMSGYTADVIVHRGELEDGVDFIQKPFSIKDLAAKVKAALYPG